MVICLSVYLLNFILNLLLSTKVFDDSPELVPQRKEEANLSSFLDRVNKFLSLSFLRCLMMPVFILCLNRIKAGNWQDSPTGKKHLAYVPVTLELTVEEKKNQYLQVVLTIDVLWCAYMWALRNNNLKIP